MYIRLRAAYGLALQDERRAAKLGRNDRYCTGEFPTLALSELSSQKYLLKNIITKIKHIHVTVLNCIQYSMLTTYRIISYS